MFYLGIVCLGVVVDLLWCLVVDVVFLVDGWIEFDVDVVVGFFVCCIGFFEVLLWPDVLLDSVVLEDVFRQYVFG